MSRIQREECLQLHNAPKKKKSARRCLFFFFLLLLPLFFFSVYYSTISRHQLRSEGYIPNSPGSVVRCHAKKKKIRVHARYPWKEKQLGGKEKRKTHTHQRCPPPPRNFPPRHQVSSRAQNMPQSSRAAHLSTETGKVLQPLRRWNGVLEKASGGKLSDAKCHKIHQCAFPLLNGASFASLSPLPPTVLALFLRRFVRFTRFFLLLTSPHTALLLHSSGCHPPHPRPHPPLSTPSVIRAASWPQCLWALPSSAHQAAALPACPALNLLKLGPTRGRAPARLRSCQPAVTTPLSGRDTTCAGRDAHKRPHAVCLSGCCCRDGRSIHMKL